ncbi:MAG: hypothetical protein ACTS5Y_08070, partial [Pollutimonas bauzanensis]
MKIDRAMALRFLYAARPGAGAYTAADITFTLAGLNAALAGEKASVDWHARAEAAEQILQSAGPW